MAIQEPSERGLRETQFEIRRGVGHVSVEHGFVQVHVSQIPNEKREEERLALLQRIAERFVNVRFPKLTPSGASFLVTEREEARVRQALVDGGDRFSMRRGRSVVSIHAPAIREEEGLTARLLAILTESDTGVEHVADAQDRLTAVMASSGVDAVLSLLRDTVESSSRPSPRRRRARRKIKVLKFGGTSVATAEARSQAAAKVAAALADGFMPVVVVSAIGRRGLPYATDTLIGQVREVCPEGAPDPRDLDLMMACGEILSAVIFARTLSASGCPAHAFRGDQAGIQTDGAFGRARIVAVRPKRLERSLDAGWVPVVCGFQGCVGPGEDGPCGEVTTLGRGGSDTTAAALGAALGAEAVEIYTDVDGIMSADPRLVPEAKPLWSAPCDEIASLAHLGAKVVHPRAAEIAQAYGTPLWIKSTFSEERGTEILPDHGYRGPRRTGVAQIEGLIYFRVDLRSLAPEERGLAENALYRRLAQAGMTAQMVDFSPTSAGLAVPAASGAGLESVLAELGMSVSVRQACALVSLVGRDYIETPGTLRDGLTTLRRAGVDVLQINAAEASLSFLVSEAAASDTVRALFEYHASMSDD